jgi:uncharacterized protein (DUF58 family)
VSSKDAKKRKWLPRKLRFTREGRVFILATLGVGAAAVNTGNNLLYLVLGLLLSLIVLSGILSELVLREVRVVRRLPKRAFAGSPCLIELAVTNDKKRAPSYSIEIEDFAPDAPCDRRCYFLKVAPGSEVVASYERTPEKRGVLRFGEIRIRTRYPFGLFEKTRSIAEEAELVVFPALARNARPELADGREGPELSTSQRGPGSEIAGVREYTGGDEARSIHWRRTASLGRLVVRERQREAARRLTLVIDEARPAGVDPNAWDRGFERALSEAARTAERALSEGASVEAVARSGRSASVLPGRAPDPIWRFLALLRPLPVEGAPPLPARTTGAVQRFEVRGAA